MAGGSWALVAHGPRWHMGPGGPLRETLELGAFRSISSPTNTGDGVNLPSRRMAATVSSKARANAWASRRYHSASAGDLWIIGRRRHVHMEYNMTSMDGAILRIIVMGHFSGTRCRWFPSSGLKPCQVRRSVSNNDPWAMWW